MTEDEIEEKSFRSLLPSESHRRINLKKRDRDYSDEEATPGKTTLSPIKASFQYSVITHACICLKEGREYREAG